MARDPCTELQATIARLALSIGQMPHVKDLAGVTAEFKKHVPEITRDEVVQSINAYTTEGPKVLTELQQKLVDLKREARNDAGLRERIGEYQKALKDATVPEKGRKATKEPPADIAALREQNKSLLSALRNSEPAIRQRFEKQIAELTDRLEGGDLTAPTKAEKPPMSKELERLAYERDRLRYQINEKIRGLKPDNAWEKMGKIIGTPLNQSRAMMTSLDFSGTLRQGGIINLANPVRAGKMLKAQGKALLSDQAAHTLQNEILNRDLAPMAHKAGLYIAPLEGTELGKMEEAVMLRAGVHLAKFNKYTGVTASQRAYVVGLNTLRADSFDSMVRTLARNGEVTAKEAELIAHYVNIATGRGDLGAFERVATQLNTAFFSPRYLASRFQYLTLQPLLKGALSGGFKDTVRVRKLIALEYLKTAMGIGTILTLGKLAGGTVETDPRSSDFGKIKFGETRVDPLMGLAQVTTFTGRVLSGQTKKESGEVVDIRGDNVPFGGRTVGDVGLDFFRSKLAPIPGAAWNIYDGKNAVGDKATIGSEVLKLITPLSFDDIYKAGQEHGLAKGAAFAATSLLGMGLQSRKTDPESVLQRDTAAAKFKASQTNAPMGDKAKAARLGSFSREIAKVNAAVKAGVMTEAEGKKKIEQLAIEAEK